MRKAMKKNHILTAIAVLFGLIVSTSLKAQTPTEWPDLPLLTIETIDGVMPTATKVYPPEGCVGEGILSEHVPGRLVMTLKGETLYDSGDYVKGESGVRIKIRGNTTGANLAQHPYKLKLSKKADLLQLGKEHKSKDFALLSMYTWNKMMKNEECNILLNTGLALCRALNFPWTPNTRPVNVVINGKYQGLYHLIETVERADTRIKTDKTGFVIENDAYWWKEGETYFRTEHQNNNTCMGYTFKYPDGDDITEEQLADIKNYMEKVETAVYSNTEASNFIDYNSFAHWVLAHDILGTSDAAGSNMFLYKENGTTENSKLKMATLWDFDSAFRSDVGWAYQHISYAFFYRALFQDKNFVRTYLNLYKEKIAAVYPYVENSLKDFKEKYGEAFEKSMELHRTVYANECRNTLDEQIDDVLTHLKERLALLEILTTNLEQVTAVESCLDKLDDSVVRRTNVYGVDFTGVNVNNLPVGIYIEKRADGTIRKVLNK